MDAAKRPSGIYNPGQACYQNSVVQGLASLQNLPSYLDAVGGGKSVKESTAKALQYAITFLNLPSKTILRMPTKLNSMRTDEQQDAQEYYGKVLDAISDEIDSSKKESREKSPGIDDLVGGATHQDKSTGPSLPENPLIGMTAQRLACTECGYTEGMTMTPFNCLTLSMPIPSSFSGSLGSRPRPSVAELMNDLCRPEVVEDVVCPKCTALSYKEKLEAKLVTLSQEHPLREAIRRRVRILHVAITEEDFSDKTLYETCNIPKNMQVRRDKIKQVGIGRPPRALAVHINRSVFDECTGHFRKNNASLIFPDALDLGPWTVPAEAAGASNGRTSMLRSSERGPSRWQYTLRATLLHSGAHSYGHYVCNRRYPSMRVRDKQTGKYAYRSFFDKVSEWWEISDEHVYAVREKDVLNDGNVFMLFYELCEEEEIVRRIAAGTDLPASDTEDEVSIIEYLPKKAKKQEVEKIVYGSADTKAAALGSDRKKDSVTEKIRALGKKVQAQKAAEEQNSIKAEESRVHVHSKSRHDFTLYNRRRDKRSLSVDFSRGRGFTRKERRLLLKRSKSASTVKEMRLLLVKDQIARWKAEKRAKREREEDDDERAGKRSRSRSMGGGKE